jgi:hypothetical protein
MGGQMIPRMRMNVSKTFIRLEIKIRPASLAWAEDQMTTCGGNTNFNLYIHLSRRSCDYVRNP